MTIGSLAALARAWPWRTPSFDSPGERPEPAPAPDHPLTAVAVELADGEAARLDRRLAIEESAQFDRYRRAGGLLRR